MSYADCSLALAQCSVPMSHELHVAWIISMVLK